MRIIYEAQEYDPNNPEHHAQWLANGSPDMKSLDGNGNPWQPSRPMVLQKDDSSYAAMEMETRVPSDSDKPAKTLDLATAKDARSAIVDAKDFDGLKAAFLAYFDARIDGR